MESRQSRMKKYYEDDVELPREEVNTVSSSRTNRNKNLYKEVSNASIEAFDLNSNVSVIGDSTENISLDEIKDILSEKYKENPRKKSFGDTDEIALPKINLDETREYDINSILEKAKEKKEVNYEKDRLKKVRNTQYDILKSLDIMNNEEEIEDEEIEEKPTDRRPAPNKEEEEKKLLDLIDTISAKELIENESSLEVTGELDPLDILSDLKGDDENTKVMGALVQDEEEVPLEPIIAKKDDDEDTLGILTDEIDKKKNDYQDNENAELELDTEKEEEPKKEKEEKSKKEEKKLEDSFISGTTTFSQKDFDDFNDLKDDMKITKLIIKILVIIIILAFLVGCVILADNFLGLGLFN